MIVSITDRGREVWETGCVILKKTILNRILVAQWKMFRFLLLLRCSPVNEHCRHRRDCRLRTWYTSQTHKDLEYMGTKGCDTKMLFQDVSATIFTLVLWQFSGLFYVTCLHGLSLRPRQAYGVCYVVCSTAVLRVNGRPFLTLHKDATISL